MLESKAQGAKNHANRRADGRPKCLVLHPVGHVAGDEDRDEDDCSFGHVENQCVAARVAQRFDQQRRLLIAKPH